MSVALEIDEDYAETTYGYQITLDDGTYSIWKSTGPISGEYVDRNIDGFVEAMQALLKYIEDGE